MKVNSVQSLLGIWVAVLGLSSCAASRRGAYDVRPENRAALSQERKASPHYRMDNEPTDTCFWIKDCQDRFVRFVMVFPPLPKKVKTVDFFIPSSASRFNFDGSEKRESGLRVEDLRPKHRIPQGEVIR